MYLRQLKKEDASYMLEWMHDVNVVEHLNADFKKKELSDAEEFIESSMLNPKRHVHYAIASDQDEYMGTVSLKNINNGSAEFAIAIRSVAMGKGYAWFAMKKIINIGFKEHSLNCIYWCVSRKNKRAIRFYDKHHFHESIDIPNEVAEQYESCDSLKWYSVLRGDSIDYNDNIVGCKIIDIKTIPTINSGELSFFEENLDIPFDIKRIYYISKVPEGTKRGFHAHKKLKQLLFCPYGEILIKLDNGEEIEEIVLSDPSKGIVIDRPIWREMTWLKKDSVLCVAASEMYSQEDYIRKYEDFIGYVKNL